MKRLRLIAQAAAQRRSEKPTATFSFGGWKYGLNTFLPATQILDEETCALCNLKKAGTGGGQWMPRPGISANTTTAVNGWKAHRFIPIAGTTRELIVDSDKKLYYNLAGVPTRIGGSRLLSSTSVFMFPFKGVALVCDGSYLKYVDGVGATGLKIAYDNGSGTTGAQYSNITGVQSNVLPLGNGTSTRVAQKFTSQAWDAGFTIPPRAFKFYASKNGSPTGAITAKLRAVADDSILATVTAYADISALTGDPELVEVDFNSGTITTEMSTATAYYVTLEYSGGDGANFVEIYYTTVSSGGLAYTYAGSYSANTTKDLVVKIGPGRPPKATSGEVFANRPWIVSPDAPGGAYTGNFTYLDWSTASYAGFVGVEDDDVNTFKVSAIKALFEGDLFFFGIKDQPYIAKLSGTDFGTYKVGRLFQRQWTTKNLLVDTHNDLWYASKEGVNSVSGIQQYGDLSTRRHSDPIRKTFNTYFDPDTDIAGYDASEGQFQLQMEDYHRLLVFHASKPELLPNGTEARYPISEYEFTVGKLSDSNLFDCIESINGTNERFFSASGTLQVLTMTGETVTLGGERAVFATATDPAWTGVPDFVLLGGRPLTRGTVGSLADHEWDYGDNDSLSFDTIYYRDDSGDVLTTGLDMRSVMIPRTIEHYNGVTYYGFSDGLSYKINSAEYKDLSLYQMTFQLRSKYVVAELSNFNLEYHQFNVAGTTGAQLNLNIYTDGQFRTPTATFSYPLPIDDRLNLVDLTMDMIDMYFSLAPTTSLPWQETGVNCSSFQVEIADMLLSGEPVFIDKLAFQIRVISK